MRSNLRLWPLFAATVLLSGAAVFAQDKPARISWSATDVAGKKVTVPVDGKISIVAFVRTDQTQSADALKAIKKVADDKAAVSIVVSGPSAGEEAKTLAGAGKYSWPIVVDPDFDASGKMNVHVWPTTIIVRSDATLAGHLAGMPISYAADLQSYLDFANHKIDDNGLEKRLTTHEVVQDDAGAQAKRHLQVALRLLETGDVDQARQEVQEGLKLQPNDSGLLLGMAKVDVAVGAANDALALLNQIPAGVAPPWELPLLRGKAYVQQERWEDATKALLEAVKPESLNPAAKAHYLLGLAYQHAGRWEQAAKEFRAAYETSPNAKMLRTTKASAGAGSAMP